MKEKDEDYTALFFLPCITGTVLKQLNQPTEDIPCIFLWHEEYFEPMMQPAKKHRTVRIHNLRLRCMGFSSGIHQ